MSRHLPGLLSLALASSCVSYVADDADTATIAAEVSARRGGHFAFAEAVATACRQNPELRALAARARAAGAALEPLTLESEYRSGTEMLAVMLDPIELLNLGPRGGRNDALGAEAVAAVAELATRRWQIAAAIAETFAVHAALSGLAAPTIAVDPDAYERAGLASAVAAARVRSARAGAAAEAAAILAEREQNLAAFRRLLGLPPRAAIELGPMPALAAVPDEAALLQRPDLALATARFRSADAAFRAAVAAQYPSLMIGPEFPIRGGPLDAMAVLRLPIGAWGAANAAAAQREAARADLEGALLAAQQEAHDSAVGLTAATAAAGAANASQLASTLMLKSATATLAVDPDAFPEVVEAAAMNVRDAMERRRADVELERARIRSRVAYGWPAVAEGS